MKIAILGFGLEGQAAYDYWKDKGDTTICDLAKIEVPEGVDTQLGKDYLSGLERFDLIVRSPIIKPSDILAASGENVKDKITSNTNEFFRVCPTPNIIGVTGTKGKGTTSTLIAKMLEASGKKVHLGGNIGVPALSLLKEVIGEDDWVVLELSSFQLIDCKFSPTIGVCLMVTPEHLNWHLETEEYLESKAQLFKFQSSEDIAVYFADNENSKKVALISQGRHIPYFEDPGASVKKGYIHIEGIDLCPTSELGLKGEHNWQNACAAVTAVWQIAKDKKAIENVLKSFEGLEHRLEYVTAINGVSYYDDSFGTTPETAIVAIAAFSEPKVVILGGSDKRASYTELARAVRDNNVRSVILIGEQGVRIREALEKEGYDNCVSGGANMKEIVNTASSLAKPGDVVLLSPACASFDMFLNYKDRGEQFKQVVRESAQAAG